MTTVEQTLVMTMILMIMKKNDGNYRHEIIQETIQSATASAAHRHLQLQSQFSDRSLEIVPLQRLQLQPALPLAANQKSGSGGARQDAITTAGGHLCWCAAVASALLLQVSLQVLVSLLTGLQLVVDGKNLMKGVNHEA